MYQNKNTRLYSHWVSFHFSLSKHFQPFLIAKMMCISVWRCVCVFVISTHTDDLHATGKKKKKFVAWNDKPIELDWTKTIQSFIFSNFCPLDFLHICPRNKNLKHDCNHKIILCARLRRRIRMLIAPRPHPFSSSNPALSLFSHIQNFNAPASNDNTLDTFFF